MRHSIRGYCWEVVFAGLALLLARSSTAGEMVVVQDGQPRATIVVAKDAAEPAKGKLQTAAAELPAYVEKTSGAKLPIVDDAQDLKGPVILVGRSRLSDALGVSVPAGVRPDRRDREARAEPLVFCGWDEVFILDLSDAEKGNIDKLWSWRARDRKELPDAIRRSFGTTDECKPVDGGAKILISFSGGGCALVERPSGRVLWYASVPNAHSLELPPRDRAIVAGSVSPNGNRLILYDLARPDRPVWESPLVSAHGVVWDEKRGLASICSTATSDGSGSIRSLPTGPTSSASASIRRAGGRCSSRPAAKSGGATPSACLLPPAK